MYEYTHMYIGHYNLLQGLYCSLNFTHSWLVGLEEEPIHIRQLHFVIVKQYQLRYNYILKQMIY